MGAVFCLFFFHESDTDLGCNNYTLYINICIYASVLKQVRSSKIDQPVKCQRHHDIPVLKVLKL